jgi:hypothetical protein
MNTAMTSFKFPVQPPEHPFAREAKNQVCIQGHLETARNALIGNTSPDSVAAILTELAHQSVEVTVAVLEATPLFKSIQALKPQREFYKSELPYEVTKHDAVIYWKDPAP